MAQHGYIQKPFDSYRQKLLQDRKKVPCPKSTTYDRAHEILVGDKPCLYKHFLYHWEGRYDNKVVLISDSICKWVRDIPHLEIFAVPGMNLSSAFIKMCSLELKTTRFDGLILHCGTNDFSEGMSGDDIVEKLGAIVTYLRQLPPITPIAISAILPRPQDKCPKKEKHRLKVNSAIKSFCKKRSLMYTESSKCVSTNNVADLQFYAHDRLHMNRARITKLGIHFKGVASALMQQKARLTNN